MAAHGLMATAHGSTKFEFSNMDNFLVFNIDKNQFKWTGSVEQFESSMLQRLNLSMEDVQSKSNNGACVVWKTPSATFNFYLKTKTLKVQGKAEEHTRQILLHSLGQSCQDSTADENVFVNEADNPSIESTPSPLISDDMSKEPKSAAQDDFVPVTNGITIDPASATKYLPFDCQKKIEEMSEELELLKKENRHYANQLQTLKEMKQSPITFFD